MKTVDEIKAAAAKLSSEEQHELFLWWTETPRRLHGARDLPPLFF